ncbi:hepatitis A virus cellular receptor 1-like isoform X2 [Mytilus californianus]|uniref:hepatitis A virus cellular receptor 1-like isoform X2 n=1 Tax=Mytilus californianus TaxID=6549 RepID=UPI0022458D03|nr:hepatitis A virus cellular receptor 1-like isoform X2 [Mytilus californianus]
MKACLLSILVALQNVALSVEGRIHTKAEYVNLGETITLQCQNSGALTSLWRRKDSFISAGLVMNNEAEGHDRLRITGDPMKGEYNLEISNITEEDLGLYWCEVLINNVAKQTKVTLRLQSHINDTRVTDEYTTKDKVLTTTIIESITDHTSQTEPQNITTRSFYNTLSETVITTDMQTQRLTGENRLPTVLIYVIVCSSCTCLFLLTHVTRRTLLYKCKRNLNLKLI